MLCIASLHLWFERCTDERSMLSNSITYALQVWIEPSTRRWGQIHFCAKEEDAVDPSAVKSDSKKFAWVALESTLLGFAWCKAEKSGFQSCAPIHRGKSSELRAEWIKHLYHQVVWCFCILTFDPAKNAIQSDAPEGSDTFQWQLWEEIAQVSSADYMGQGEGPTSEWCTGREWPVNCMAVISAWWRSNMPFQRLSGRLSGRWTII